GQLLPQLAGNTLELMITSEEVVVALAEVVSVVAAEVDLVASAEVDLVAVAPAVHGKVI
ncbi:MAG: hypothetical protein ACI923_002723, partial [Flavobacteriales bacterium]